MFTPLVALQLLSANIHFGALAGGGRLLFITLPRVPIRSAASIVPLVPYPMLKRGVGGLVALKRPAVVGERFAALAYSLRSFDIVVLGEHTLVTRDVTTLQGHVAPLAGA